MKFISAVTLIVLSSHLIHGCASLPQESVSLNVEVSNGIKEIHKSNVRLINHYFALKIKEVDQFEKEAIDDFFNAIIGGMSNSNAQPLTVMNLQKINSKVNEIHAEAAKYRNELIKAKEFVTENAQSDYNLLINANNTITGLLQSAVEVSQARNEGFGTIKELTSGKVDFHSVEGTIDNYVQNLGAHSAKTTDLVEAIKKLTSTNQ